MSTNGRGIKIKIFDYHQFPPCDMNAGANPENHSFNCQYPDKPLTSNGCTLDEREGAYYCEHEDIVLLNAEHEELVAALLDRLAVAGLRKPADKPRGHHHHDDGNGQA